MFCVRAGDVLQLRVPLRGADLLPGAGAAPQRLHGWDSAHVHTQGNTVLEPIMSKCNHQGGLIITEKNAKSSKFKTLKLKPAQVVIVAWEIN